MTIIMKMKKKEWMDVKCIFGSFSFKNFRREEVFLFREIAKIFPLDYISFIKEKIGIDIIQENRNILKTDKYNIYILTLIEPKFLEIINFEINQIMILTEDELFDKKIYYPGEVYYKSLLISLPALSYDLLYLNKISLKERENSIVTLNILSHKTQENRKKRLKVEYSKVYSKVLLEKIKRAPEIPINAIEIYDAILIEPLDENTWDSGYRTLNFYGYLKIEESGEFIIEKIGSRDCLNIHTLFRKLKGFEVTIDIPFYTNIIRIYCKNHLIQVENREFKFIKK